MEEKENLSTARSNLWTPEKYRVLLQEIAITETKLQIKVVSTLQKLKHAKETNSFVEKNWGRYFKFWLKHYKLHPHSKKHICNGTLPPKNKKQKNKWHICENKCVQHNYGNCHHLLCLWEEKLLVKHKSVMQSSHYERQRGRSSPWPQQIK